MEQSEASVSTRRRMSSKLTSTHKDSFLQNQPMMSKGATALYFLNCSQHSV